MMILPFKFCDACRRWQELQIPGSVVFLAHHQGSGCAAIASIVSISSTSHVLHLITLPGESVQRISAAFHISSIRVFKRREISICIYTQTH